jgi:hypothetical protein
VYQTLTCLIAVAGDLNQTVHRGPTNTITYPELLILKFIHGEASITDIHDYGVVARSQREERERLAQTYSRQVVDMLYPGVAGRLPAREDGYPKYKGARPEGYEEYPPEASEPDGKPKRGRATVATAPVPASIEPLDVDVPDLMAGGE